jgi:hypothetical protein
VVLPISARSSLTWLADPFLSRKLPTFQLCHRGFHASLRKDKHILRVSVRRLNTSSGPPAPASSQI